MYTVVASNAHSGGYQCTQALHQEAGRAGRDGKEAHCTLFADLRRPPSLLPNAQRTAARTRVCLGMLLAVHAYACARDDCRQRILLGYLGEVRLHRG